MIENGDIKMDSLYSYPCKMPDETPIHWSVKFGKNVTLGHNVVIEENVIIGDNVIIVHNTVICKNAIVPDYVRIGHCKVYGI